jgi:beta-phosphoglucomutase-like phosphatase (HAD superfamily)
VPGVEPAGWEDFLRDLPVPLALGASSGTWRLSWPDPRFFTRVCEMLSLPPARVACVGDRLDNGVPAALEAGMVAVQHTPRALGLGARAAPGCGTCHAADQLADGPSRGAGVAAAPSTR